MESSTTSTYRTHPVHLFPALTIDSGFSALARILYRLIDAQTGPQTLVIDGFVGLPWHDFMHELMPALEKLMPSIRWLSTDTCFRESTEIQTLLTSSLTTDPVFGRIFHGHLQDLWSPRKLADLQAQLTSAQTGQLTVLYGFGSSEVATEGVRVYIDVPKDRAQQLAGQKQICNVGATEPEDFKTMYKRFYFVDWPILNRIKRNALPHIDLFIDATDWQNPRFVSGDDFRHVLHDLAYRPFRVKPWFAPGPWGGQWMKEQFGLPPEQPNYAWSFELIAPENGILLGNQQQSIECSFDYLLWSETDAVLGVPVSARYGSYFPIRLDYLDTMEGTNLSCQVHPHVDYIRDEFGEPFTQDETYYIVANKPGTRVFLGLRDDADIASFQADALAARDQAIPFDISKYVHSEASEPHALFLIPSGTVHCSGANNLVLEISATPYIYTFKIYDYLRKDLSGELRHVHLDHAFANIDASRRTSWVQKHLRPAPVLLRSGTDWSEYSIGDIEQLFFAIHRLEFSDSIEDNTNEKFLALNMVEGERCQILTPGNEPVELHFAESMIIPASIGLYRLQNLGDTPCKVVKAFVKG